MKLYGVFGKGSGKVGNSVWAISGGEQIVRPYNPNVTNPNTDAQVAQRAKLKLMSQLAAALAPALGFAKKGLVSARNQFVSKNIALATFTDENAVVNVTDLQLTPSETPIPGVSPTAGGSGSLNVALEAAAPADVKRVAYFVYRQTENDKLEYVASKIISVAGDGRTFPTSFSDVAGDLVVYAYGVKDANASATLRYENYLASAGDTNASLQVISMFRSADYALTATSGVLISVQ